MTIDSSGARTGVEPRWGSFPLEGFRFQMIGRFGCVRVSVGCSDWLNGCAVIFFSPGGVRIGYIKSVICGRSSTDAAPVTGSLVFFAPLDCLSEYCAAECASGWLFIWQVGLYWIKTMECAALVEDHACITFGVELYVPWDALEAIVDIHSEGVVPLGSNQNVVGLVGRRPDAAESHILQGRDVCSICVLVRRTSMT